LRTFRHYLRRWPDHPRAPEVRQTAAGIEARMNEHLSLPQLTGADAMECAILHEEVQALLARGLYSQARQKAETLLVRRPDFTSAVNNMGNAYLGEGNLEQAVVCALRSLAIDAENIHGLSDLTRYLCLSGRWSEARDWAEKLKATEAKGSDAWAKKAEALSYLGDDDGLVALLRQFEEATEEQRGVPPALFHHLVAVACQRLGLEEDARREWQQCLRIQPGFSLARDNLDDLGAPIGERHGPWPFSFNYWLTAKLLKEVNEFLKALGKSARDEALRRHVPAFLEKHPAVTALVPVLLERGDRAGRSFALHFALAAATPAMLAAARDFAFGRRGPDRMRTHAMQGVMKAGLVSSGPKRMWMNGEWRDVQPMGWEVTGEPLSSFRHSPRVAAWIREGIEAIHGGDRVRAEMLFKKALAEEPDSPDLLNNLGAVYSAQGRKHEADELARQMYERFPAYLFGIVAMAQLRMREGRLPEAKALLDRLLKRPRFHISEFGAVCAAQIDYWLAQGRPDGARPWLDMWQKTDQGSAALPSYRDRVHAGEEFTAAGQSGQDAAPQCQKQPIA
jgi:tetratricopeptide (TPR) repeat protein